MEYCKNEKPCEGLLLHSSNMASAALLMEQRQPRRLFNAQVKENPSIEGLNLSNSKRLGGAILKARRVPIHIR